MRRHHHLLVAGLALALVGCSRDLNFAAPPLARLAGTWVHIREANQPPGSFMQWNLTVSGFHRVFEGTLTSSTDLAGTGTNNDQTSGTEHMRKSSAAP